MPDRTDIDALLIGALYGELTAADEARLTAHLESHPADRTALADLTRTRAAVRDSRLLAFELEPPQAISAILLREASRRAPRPARQTASWFQRFTRAFMAHPAMAAAAMLVLVVSVAGTLYLRGSDQLAAPRPVTASAPHEPSTTLQSVTTGTPNEQAVAAPSAEPAPPAAAPPRPEPRSEREAKPQADDQRNPGSAGGAAVSSDGYRVRLGEVDSGQREARKRAASDDGDLGLKQQADAVDRVDRPEKTKSAVRTDRPAKLAKKSAGIEVRTPELAPKELDEDSAFSKFKADRARDDAPASGNQRGQHANGATSSTGVASSPGGAPAPAAPAPRTAPPADPAEIAERGQVSDAKKSAAKPTSVAGSAANAAPPPPPAQAVVTPPNADVSNARTSRGVNNTNTKAGRTDDKLAGDDQAARDKALLAWARKQHDQVIALVGSSNCRAAASAAGEIYSRAPSYYAANIVTDRSIRACLPYLNSERDRRAAAKRAVRTEDAASVPADNSK
jgi:hypothetical protein